jgi:hypothetical protein
MRGLFRPFEDHGGPSVSTAGVLCFHLLFGSYVRIFFGFRPSYFRCTYYFHCVLDFRILLFRLKTSSIIYVLRNTSNRLWEPPTLNQVLADQCRPRQLQHPSAHAPLVTTYKDTDLRHASRQSQSTKYPLLSNGSIIRPPWKQIGTTE